MIPLWKLRRELKRLFRPRARCYIPQVSEQDRAFLSALSGRYQGQRCFIIGNGPSLCAGDLDLIKGEISFASNKIYLAYDSTNWRPDFYSVEDHLVLTQGYDEITRLEGSTKLIPIHMMKWVERTADMHCFPIIEPKRWSNPLEDPNFPAFSSDFEAGIGWGSTIVYTQIQLAMAMGFTTICILGLDHSYAAGAPVKDDKGVMISEGEQNHFHADYRKPGEKWHSPNLHVLDVSYAKARAEADARGARILNCSRQTCLDAFERVTLEEIVGK